MYKYVCVCVCVRVCVSKNTTASASFLNVVGGETQTNTKLNTRYST